MIVRVDGDSALPVTGRGTVSSRCLLLLGLVLTGVSCTESPTGDGDRMLKAQVLLNAQTSARAGERIALHFTTPSGSARQSLQRDTLSVQPGANQLASTVEITSCVGSSGRCAVYIAITLLSSSSLTLDSTEVGPIEVGAGSVALAPTVSLVAAGSVRLTRTAVALRLAESTQLGALVLGRSGDTLSGRSVAWQSRNPTVATVSTSGLVRAVAPGTTTVTAVVGEARDSAVVTVVPVPVALVSVRFASSDIAVGTSTQATATATDSGGNVLTGRPVAWSSSNTAIASVSSAGIVTGLAPGAATIVAQVAGITGQAIVRVSPAVSVSVAPASLSLAAGASAPLTASVSGGVPGGSSSVAWTSRNPTVTTVSSVGVVTGLAAGSTHVLATSVQDSTKADSVRVTVGAPLCGGLPATVRAGLLQSSETWTAAQSPYLLNGNVVVRGGATLRVNPGVTICGTPAAALIVESDGLLQAIGTRTQPIMFQPSDSSRGWFGLRFTGGGNTVPTSRLMHVLITGGLRNVSAAPPCDYPGPLFAASGHVVQLDSVRIHRSTGVYAAYVASAGSILRDVAVDSVSVAGTCQSAGRADGLLVGGGVTASGILVSNAAGAAMRLLGGSVSTITLGSVRLERSGQGLLCAGADDAVRTGPIVITANQGVPFQCTARVLARLAPDSLSMLSWLGNARDSIIIDSGASVKRDTLRHFGTMPWRVNSTVDLDSGGVMDLRPGAVLAMNGGSLGFIRGGRLVARGTQTRPVLLTAVDSVPGWNMLFFDDVAPDSSYLINTIVEHASRSSGWAIWVHSGAHRIAIDSSWIRKSKQSGVLLQLASGRLARTLIDSTANVGLSISGTQLVEDVVVRASGSHGVQAFAGTVNGLEVTQSGAEGIRYSPNSGLSFTRVNLMGNAGAGFINLTTSSFALPGAWWGDPAGPAGPLGDGVSGPVTWIPASTVRHAIAVAPPRR
ncbi:MAG: Ig-like domain-containing protein [Gemmatimonadetes bacterium]|nr:Ig-like domain-containing protein [Gemmatimonadota bacterium]